MSLYTRKNIIITAAVVLILVGALGVYAVRAHHGHGVGTPVMHRQLSSPDQRAQKIAETFGLDKREILNYFEQGNHFRDLSCAAFLAKACDQSLQQVMAIKTPDKTWRNVAESLGITPEKAKAARQDIMAGRMEKLHISKQNSLDLMQQGYRPHDIAMAQELAENTSQSIQNVLSLRKINNTWRDVAKNLGVSEDILKQDMQNISEVFPHKGMRLNRIIAERGQK
jgi:hypothetical protein